MQKKLLIIPLLLVLGMFLFGCLGANMNTLTVSVVDYYGDPIEGATVNIYTNYSLNSGFNNLGDSLKWATLSGNLDAGQKTNASGTVSFTLPQAKYAINAYANDYFYNGTEVTLNGSQNIQITLIKNEKLSELLDNESYTVTQGMYSKDREYGWNFSSEIKLFKDSGADDFQYFTNGSKIVLCEITPGSIFVTTGEDCGTAISTVTQGTGDLDFTADDGSDMMATKATVNSITAAGTDSGYANMTLIYLGQEETFDLKINDSISVQGAGKYAEKYLFLTLDSVNSDGTAGKFSLRNGGKPQEIPNGFDNGSQRIELGINDTGLYSIRIMPSSK